VEQKKRFTNAAREGTADKQKNASLGGREKGRAQKPPSACKSSFLEGRETAGEVLRFGNKRNKTCAPLAKRTKRGGTSKASGQFGRQKGNASNPQKQIWGII